jgi:hypothetical protein
MTTGVSVRTLASPGFVFALVVLVLNDHLLKQAWPGFVTGKLSDVAGLVVAPLLLAVPLSVVRVARPAPVAIMATGIGFTLTKTSAAGAAITSDLWSLTGIATHIRADVTDLSALPALYAAWLVHRQARGLPPGQWRSTVSVVTGTAMLPVAVLATAATSECFDYEVGVTDLTVVRGEFAGPPEQPETRILFDRDKSVDATGSVAVLPEYDRMRLSAGGDYTDGVRTCSDDDSCWRIGATDEPTVEVTPDDGGMWLRAYQLSQAEADRAMEGVEGGTCDGGPPQARFRGHRGHRVRRPDRRRGGRRGRRAGHPLARRQLAPVDAG